MSPPEHGPTPRPEAELIRRARQARGLTPEQAADGTPIRIKRFRWLQIETGFKGRPDTSDPVKAPAKTLAHMANTVGVTPERLAETGREDAAEILREIQRVAALPPPQPEVRVFSDPRAQGIWDLDLPLHEREQMIRDLVEADLRRAREREERAG